MMDKSKKLVLAMCVAVTFLTGVVGCMVETRDLEKKDTFVCKVTPGCMDKETGLCVAEADLNKDGIPKKCEKDYCAATADDSCLTGSVCIAASRDDKLGRCVLIDEVEHCHDNDNDGFYGADPGFDDTCGFTTSSPKDCDDGEASINPKMTEFCDGVDNSCDGCVDGICPKTGCDEKGKYDGEGTYACDCVTYPSACQPLIELCFGVGSADSMLNVAGGKAVCSPKIGGVLYCSPETNGKNQYRVMNEDGTYGEPSGESCPADDSLMVGSTPVPYTYDEVTASEGNNKLYCNGYDSDCNGTIDCIGETNCDCEAACVAPIKGKDDDICYSNGVRILTLKSTDTSSTSYDAYQSKKEDDSNCVGVMQCKTSGIGAPVCHRDGKILKPDCTLED